MGTIPIPGPLRIRLGSGFSLATGATGITPQGPGNRGVNRARRPWILVIPAGVAGVAWPYPGDSRVPMKTRNPGIGDPSWIKETTLVGHPRMYWLLGPLCGPGSPDLL